MEARGLRRAGLVATGIEGVHPLKVQGCQNNDGELSFLWGVSMLWRVLTSIASAQEKPVSKPVNAATSGSGWGSS